MDAEFLQQVLQELVADQTGAAVAGPQVMYIVVSAHAAGELPSCCSPSGHELTYKTKCTRGSGQCLLSASRWAYACCCCKLWALCVYPQHLHHAGMHSHNQDT